MRVREHGPVRYGASERGSLERRKHVAGSLLQRDSSPALKTHYAKMSSSQPAAFISQTLFVIGPREEPVPHRAGIPDAHALTALPSTPPLPNKLELGPPLVRVPR